MRREVASVVVSCIFSNEDCPWKGEVRHLKVFNYLYFAKEFREEIYTHSSSCLVAPSVNFVALK